MHVIAIMYARNRHVKFVNVRMTVVVNFMFNYYD